MTFSNNKFYAQSNSLSYDPRTGPQLDPYILRGRTSVYRQSLPLLAQVLLHNKVPTDLVKMGYLSGNFMKDLEAWKHSFQELKGTDIYAEGSPGMIGVLPQGNFQYFTYEDEVFETTKFNCGTAASTYGTNVVKIPLSATAVNGVTPVNNFQVNDLITNWSAYGAARQYRVSAVDYTYNELSVVAFNPTAALTQIIDVLSADTAADLIEITGTAEDLRNGTLPTARTTPDFRVSGVSIKSYNLQQFEETWDVSNVADTNLRFTGQQQAPQQARNAADAMWRCINKMSRSFLWGRSTDVGSATDRQSFAGINQTISTNTTALASGALSLSDLDEMLVDKLGGTHSSNFLYGFCSRQTVSIIESLFNSLGSHAGYELVKYQDGNYGLEINVIRYRGREIHLLPLADFMTQSNRQFPDQTETEAARYAGNLFLIDPEAIRIVTGSHKERGAVFFDIDKNVQNPGATYYQQLNCVRNLIGFGLFHEATSGVIKNIQSADLTG